ncbi:AAA family ATPase [Rhodoplanes azumiensis]|uniref:AAA family ATPase n=1 Tax=Rhodoplanes azumiensis TaxID=1897628 RepID=A0ABW5APV2_9BRAD
MSATPLPFMILSDDSAVTPKQWLVPDWFGAGDVAVLVGAPGAGKSTLAASLAAAVADGRPWFGRPVESGAVLWLALERAGDSARNLKVATTADGASRVAIVDHSVNLASRSDADRVVDAARRLSEQSGHRVRLIVLDNLSLAASGADENAASAMTPLMANAGRIAAASGATVVLIHHARRNGGVRGSNAIEGRADSVVSVSGDAKKIARVVKANAACVGQAIEFVIVPVTFGRGGHALVAKPIDEMRGAARAMKARALIEELATDGRVNRRLVLRVGRERGVFTEASDSEQLRQALVLLKAQGVLDYDANEIVLSNPNGPTPPSTRGGGEFWTNSMGVEKSKSRSKTTPIGPDWTFGPQNINPSPVPSVPVVDAVPDGDPRSLFVEVGAPSGAPYTKREPVILDMNGHDRMPGKDDSDAAKWAAIVNRVRSNYEQ